MKAKFYLSILVLFLFIHPAVNGQDEFIALSSAQFLKGLDNQDYLRKVLSDNGFTLRDKWKVKNLKGGIYEYWEYDSVVYVDMILMRGRKADITVRILSSLKDFPVRLLETFPFNENSRMGDLRPDNVNLTKFRKDKAYSLRYARDGRNFGVFVWYDDPFYYFEYTFGE
jgi:hypothetical protein